MRTGDMTNGADCALPSDFQARRWWMLNEALQHLLSEALMASVFVCPLAPGLTHQELLEVGRRAGYQDGTTGDALKSMRMDHESDRWTPMPEAFTHRITFMPEDPEFLDFKATDIIVTALNERISAVGAQDARVDRGVVTELAVRAGCDQTAAQAALVFMVRVGLLDEDGNDIRSKHRTGAVMLPGEWNRKQRGSGPGSRAFPHPHRAKALAIVKEIIGRRGDGRPTQADPLDAFPETIAALGLARFRMWWIQTVAELRASDPNTMPTAITVLAAALVEGALSFAVEPARDRSVGPLLSKSFDKPSRTWNIADLVTSAAAGGDAAILGPALKGQADLLVQARHRIHAGRLMEEFPDRLPDLRPEEARAAIVTAEHVARAVMDWLARFPAA